MSPTALDALVTTFHASRVAIFLMSAVGATMWQIVVVANSQLVLVDA